MKVPLSRAVVGLAGVAGLCLWAVAVSERTIVHAQAGDTPPFSDPVARLGKQLERGEVALEFRPGFGYLPSLLERLDVRVDSQVLVFSKTSFQQALISPRNPRAIFFNDQVAIGTVPGGEVLELMAVDPKEGMVFYSMKAGQAERPRFDRRGIECQFCHGPGNHGAPALVVASVIPNPEGTPLFTGTLFGTTDHRTPLDDRWGGWYVTGTHGSQRHQGNAIAPDPERPFDLEQSGTQNRTTLPETVDATRYLTESSDIVALMTLEHQSGMTNRITSVTAQYRHAERSGLVQAPTWSRLDAAIDDLIAYLLFVDEAPLREAVEGVSTFSQTFPERGPRDARGRSLRDFDLQTRLFRYPMSYMVYSALFDNMPRPIHERVCRRLFEVLTGRDSSPKFAALSATDRRAVFEILLETKSNLPAYWTATAP